MVKDSAMEASRIQIYDIAEMPKYIRRGRSGFHSFQSARFRFNSFRPSIKLKKTGVNDYAQ